MAKARTKAAAKPAAAKAAAKTPTTGPELLDGIFVRSLPATFRRAGFTFTREGVGLLLADLSPQQLDAIEAEPLLSVTHAQFPATEEADAKLAELAKAQAETEGDGAKDGANDPTDQGAGDAPAAPGADDQTQGDQP
jgi:hypothetical protein